MPELYVVNSSIAVIIFLFAFIRGKEMVVPAIVASEFIFSNGIVEALITLDKTGGLFFYANYTIAGLVSVLIAAFIATYFVIMEISRSAVIVSVLYFLYGIFAFLVVIESMPFDGGYPLELVGLYNHIEYINNTFCVLILTVTGFSVVGGNGNRIRNSFNMLSGNAGGYKFMLFSGEGRRQNSNDEAR